ASRTWSWASGARSRPVCCGAGAEAPLEKPCRRIRDPDDLVGGLPIIFEVQLGLGPAVLPVREGPQLRTALVLAVEQVDSVPDGRLSAAVHGLLPVEPGARGALVANGCLDRVVQGTRRRYSQPSSCT